MPVTCTSGSAFMFQVLDNRHTRWGQELFAATADVIRPGIIVMFSGTSGSVTEACDGDTRPIGIAYGSRLNVYRPLDQCYDADEPHVVITGGGHALLGPSLFTGGSFPGNLNQTLYAGANGLWHVTGTYQIGRYLGQKNYWAGAGIQAQTAIAHVEFLVEPYDS